LARINLTKLKLKSRPPPSRSEEIKIKIYKAAAIPVTDTKKKIQTAAR